MLMSADALPWGVEDVGDSDVAVQGTSDDAAISKLSCARLGYFNDPFLPLFVNVARPPRRSPLINRGYYSRVQAFMCMILEFLQAVQRVLPAQPAQPAGPAAAPKEQHRDSSSSSSSPTSATHSPRKHRAQVVSLGAGFDTTYWKLKSGKDGLRPDLFVEVDFEDSLRRKARIIAHHAALRDVVHPPPPSTDQGNTAQAPDKKGEALPPIKGKQAKEAAKHWPQTEHFAKGDPFQSPDYRMVPADLRDLKALDRALRDAGVDFTAPTLFLSECVLVYIPPESSAAILEWASASFTGGAVLATYEQIHPHDRFGEVMVGNLQRRGCPLKSLHAYPTLEAQHQRFIERGWPHHAAWNMNDIYRFYLPRADVTRIEKLELFDEFEEWYMLQGHYCISMGCTERFRQVYGPVGLVERKKEASTTEAVSTQSAGEAFPGAPALTDEQRLAKLQQVLKAHKR